MGHVLLVGLAPRRQKAHRIAGQRFKLHVAGAAPKAGTVYPAVRAGLLQGVEVGRDVGVKSDAVLFQFADIPIGFVHHIEDGGGLFDGCIAVREIGPRLDLPGGFHLVQQGVDRVLAVVLRRVDLQIGEVGHKPGDDPVPSIVAVLHPGVGIDAEGLSHGRLQIDAEHQGQQSRHRRGDTSQPHRQHRPAPPPVQEKGQHGHPQQDAPCPDHAGLHFQAGGGCHPRGFLHLGEVPGEERFAPQLQGIKVDRRRDQPGAPRRQRRQRGQPGDGVHHRPDQGQQQPGQHIGFIMGADVLRPGLGGQLAPGHPLGQGQKDQRRQRRKDPPGQTNAQGRRLLVFHRDPLPAFRSVLVEACRIASYYSAV